MSDGVRKALSVQAADYWGVVAWETRFRVIVRRNVDGYTVQELTRAGWRPRVVVCEVARLLPVLRECCPELVAACAALPDDVRALRVSLAPPGLAERLAATDAAREAFELRHRALVEKRNAAYRARRRALSEEWAAKSPQERARIREEKRSRREPGSGGSLAEPGVRTGKGKAK